MSKETQIEKRIDEMLNEICTNCTYLLVCEDEHLKQVCRFAKMAKVLYDAGYRKQIEWISVHDRLPEEKEIERSFFDHETLALLDVEPQLCSDEVLVVVRAIEENYAFVATDCTKEGKWLNWQYGDYEVTHWMPLHEPPKGD